MRKELSRHAPASWSTRPSRQGDEAHILALLQRVFGIERSPDYWKWKFGTNPAGYQIILGETPKGEIIAQIAGVPVLMQAEGRQVIFTQVVDLMADPSLRRSLRKAGIYVTLLGAMIQEFGKEGRADLMYGLPIRSSDRVPQAVFGWHEAHRITRVVRKLEGSERPVRLSGLKRWRYRVGPIVTFGEETDRLWQRCRSDFRLAAIRDARYLNWRYVQCPHIRYHPHILWDRWRDQPVALSVLRLGWEGQPLAALVEWLVPRGDTDAATALLAHAEAIAWEAGMAELTAWFHPEGPEHRFFLLQGYTAELTQYPLLAKPYTSTLAWEWIARHWYYTMGDSDIH